MTIKKRPTYAGIGARRTPNLWAPVMRGIAAYLEAQGWILHSGGALGADSFFESGVKDTTRNARIFLPWQGFNGNPSPWVRIDPKARAIAAEFHPAFGGLSQGVQKLMSRNSYQVLGPLLDTPVDAVVCWTANGETSGGTGQALRIAQAHGVPSFNLHDPTALDRLAAFVGRSTRFHGPDSA